MNRDFKPRRRWALAAVTAVLVSGAIAACGSSSHQSTKTTAALRVAPIEAPCQQVASVLSDGPDPGADPVGYAQAQIIQLRKLNLSHTKLEEAVDALASAYQQFSRSGGNSAAAKAAVNTTSQAVDAICPGATP